MSKIQLKITHHTKNKDNINLNEKSQSVVQHQNDTDVRII